MSRERSRDITNTMPITTAMNTAIFIPARSQAGEFMTPNGTHQRPHADGSARGRDRPVNAQTMIARGRLLYVSRLAAWVCSASRAFLHLYSGLFVRREQSREYTLASIVWLFRETTERYHQNILAQSDEGDCFKWLRSIRFATYFKQRHFGAASLNRWALLNLSSRIFRQSSGLGLTNRVRYGLSFVRAADDYDRCAVEVGAWRNKHKYRAEVLSGLLVSSPARWHV
jgi:hypothetical protein